MTTLPRPYFQDERVTLYHGDARDILPLLGKADAIIADPPYGETCLEWDVWPEGWPDLALSAADQMWCFGSMRMFLAKTTELSGWTLAQDVIWEKHNGSNNSNDRFRRIHENILHFYQGRWSELYKSPQFTKNATARTVRRQTKPTHWNDIRKSTYASVRGGPKLMRSVLYARSCHGYAVNETQKPEAIIQPLLLYSVPPGGLVIDPFAGSGTTLSVARKNGRRAIGIEKRESQCRKATDRLLQMEVFA